MLPRVAALFIATSITACGGVVIIDGGGDGGGSAAAGDVEVVEPSLDGAGGSRSAPPPAPPPPGTDGGWADDPGGTCVNDCRAWIDACADDQPCVEPQATCEGRQSDLANGLVACVCAGCAERCGGSCVMFDTQDPECLECQQNVLKQTCVYEYHDCSGL